MRLPSRANGLLLKRYGLDLPPREKMLRLVEELQPLEPRLSFKARTILLRMLGQIIDQMAPARDPRVKPGVWQVAMLAAALVAEHAEPTLAVLAAVETLSPGRAQDQKFRDLVERNSRKVRGGKNPARPQLLPVPRELLERARVNLKRRNAQASSPGTSHPNPPGQNP